MNFKDLIFEALDTYPFKFLGIQKAGEDRYEFRYEFKTETENSYVVHGYIFIESPKKKTATVSFYPKGGSQNELTSENIPFSVAKTVGEVLKDLHDRYEEIETVSFYADERRNELYDRVVKRHFPSAKTEFDDGYMKIYLL